MSHKSQSSDCELQSGDQWPPCRCDAGNRLMLKKQLWPLCKCLHLSGCWEASVFEGCWLAATLRIKRPLTPCISTHVCYGDAAILVSARVNGKQLPCITVSVVFHSPCMSVESFRGSGSVATATYVWSRSDCLLIVISSIISIMRWRWGSCGEPELRAVAERCWKRRGV